MADSQKENNIYITDDEIQINEHSDSSLVGKTGFVNLVDEHRVWVSVWDDQEQKDIEVLCDVSQIQFRVFTSKV